MIQIQTSMEIAASPAVVRAKFLDFSQIPKYSPNGFFKSLGPKTPGTPLEPGVVMDNHLEGMKIQPVVTENSPSSFSWRGSLIGIFVGEHYFHFEPSKVTPGGTTFHHGEDFSGLISGMIGENVIANAIGMRKKTISGFEAFNADFKKWVESEGKESIRSGV